MKYEFVKPALWQDENGRFISLDHTIPIGANGITLTEYYSGSSQPVTDPTTDPTTEPTTGGDDITYGDADGDGEVMMNDGVLIMQALANNDKYGIGGSDKNALKEENLDKADCFDPGSGLSVKDALSVQKFLLELITLPERSK